MRPNRALDIYLSDFKQKHGGIQDFQSIFEQVRATFGGRRALYPGSYLHVMPALVFPETCFVDSLNGIEEAFANAALRDYIGEHRTYDEDVTVRCYQEDYRGFDSEPEESFDLLVSLNAGHISQDCKRFLKQGGLLLVNDGHHDARRAFVDPDYDLIGASEGDAQHLEMSERRLSRYFKTTRDQLLTREMVEADADRAPSKARFKLAREADIYLFRRN